MLGAFIDRVGGPQLPVRIQIWLVARLEWLDEDFGNHHTVVIKIEREDDGEQVARIDGEAFTDRPPSGAFDPEMPIGGNLVIPIPAEFRRDGLYSVSLSVDAEELWRAPLKVHVELPQV